MQSDVIDSSDIDMMIGIIETLTLTVNGVASEECSSEDDNTCHSDDNRAATEGGNVLSIAWMVINTAQDNDIFIPLITNDEIMIDNNRTAIIDPTSQILFTTGALYTAVTASTPYPCTCQRA